MTYISLHRRESDKRETVLKAIFDFYKVRKELPTTEDLIKRLNMLIERISNVLQLNRNVISLDAKISEDSDNSFEDFIETDTSFDDIMEQKIDAAAIDSVLQTLPKRTREIIILRFGLDGRGRRTLAEIADIYGISKERVRQIVKEKLEKDKAFRARIAKAIYAEDSMELLGLSK